MKHIIILFSFWAAASANATHARWGHEVLNQKIDIKNCTPEWLRDHRGYGFHMPFVANEDQTNGKAATAEAKNLGIASADQCAVGSGSAWKECLQDSLGTIHGWEVALLKTDVTRQLPPYSGASYKEAYHVSTWRLCMGDAQMADARCVTVCEFTHQNQGIN